MKSMKKQGGRCWSAAAILLLLLAALVLPRYAAAQTGQISGTVKDSGGVPLQDVEVYVYDAKDTSGIDPFPVTTNKDGIFTAPDLPPGEYRYKVRFLKDGYIEQWHEGVSMIDCATPLTVIDGQTTSVKDAVLVQGTNSAIRRSLAKIAPAESETSIVISGNVTLDGSGLKCAQVEVYDAADTAADPDWIDQVFTDYQGNYTINGLPSGSYKILFYNQNGEFGQWYNRKAGIACADAVSENASGINAAFPVSLRQCGDRPTILPAINLLLN